MSKLKKSIPLETTFGIYVVDELLGEGGAGRVYGGVDPDRKPIALKLLAEERVTAEQRGRFKNEISFLVQNRHRNIVTVTDHGVSRSGELIGPFYVMRKYKGSLRQLMRARISPDDVLPLYSQILDGVEAAHLQNVVHRDLKPENILHENETKTLAIADFGIARFTADFLATVVETAPAQRLANFQYAAPEQRTPRQHVGISADIYALGLILNEMYTGAVPQGTEYQLISGVSKEFGFLDDIVEKMLRQIPEERPSSIAGVKELILRYQNEAVSLQILSRINSTVISAQEIDDPLALHAPQLVSADWNDSRLTLTLDRAVSHEWINALHNMGSHSSVYGKPPQAFTFYETQATVGAQENEVQPLIEHFKNWLPKATQGLKYQLEQRVQRQQAEQKEKLRREREAEEQRLRVMRNIKI